MEDDLPPVEPAPPRDRDQLPELGFGQPAEQLGVDHE
jgi:hypothetical protein